MLRDYQKETLAASWDAFQRGVWSQMMVLPTGAGKTVVFAHLPHQYRGWIEQFPDRQQKMLVLAHRDELIDQAWKKLDHYNPDLRIGIEAAKRRATPMDDVVVASVQTLTAGNGGRLSQLDPMEYRIVVIDEAHHAPAVSYQQVLRHFDLVQGEAWQNGATVLSVFSHSKPSNNLSEVRALQRQWWKGHWPNRLLIGVTATPNRADNIGLEWTFNELVYEKTIRWMVQRGYLVPPVGWFVDTGVDLDGVKMTAGDFNVGALAQAVNTPRRNEQTVAAWAAKAIGRRSIAFCCDIKHARDLANAFQQTGVNAAWVSGDGGWALGGASDRDYIVARYKEGAYDVLCNCNLLTEGFDDPATSCIIMARPTTSQGLYMQMLGRGLRPSESKQDCLVLDVVDVARKHSIVTAGDLFGLPRLFNAKGEELTALADSVEAALAACPDLPLVDGLDPASFAAHVKAFNIWAVSESDVANKFARLRWIEAKQDVYRLALPAKQAEDGALVSGANAGIERLEISQSTLGAWAVRVYSSGLYRHIGETDDLGGAFLKAERWVEFERPDAFAIKAKDAPWRDKPASEKQRLLLAKLGAPGDLSKLTRGQASDMLDKFYGSRGRK